MNIFVPLFVVAVAVCWFLVATGRVAPTDPRLLGAVVAATAAGAAFFLYTYAKAGRERARALRRVADELGWEFAERVPLETLPGAESFEIFTGRSEAGGVGWRTRREAENVLRGEAGGVGVWAFDLVTTATQRPVGAAGRGAYTETLVCARLPGARLPRFTLAPKGLWPGLGGREIGPPARPEFSRLYTLRGEDEGAVRRLFERPALAAFFESREDLCAEGDGDRLVLYRQGVSLAPERLRPFIGEALEAAGLFKGARASLQP